MFLPHSNVYRAPLKEKSVQACRKTNCGIKETGVYLGRTLPSLLDEGCEQSFVIGQASGATINHDDNGHWASWTLLELRQGAEEIALGLCQYAGLEKGDRVALLMDSNVSFVMADIGCLLARLVTVPIPPEQPVDNSEHILKETAASVLFVSELKPVEQLLPRLADLKALRLIVVVNADDKTAGNHSNKKPQSSARQRLASLRWSVPRTIEVVTLEILRQRVQWSAAKVQALRAAISPQDLATIVYTLRPNGLPLGAMLTHENLSGSVLAAFSTLPCLRKGPSEISLSFLPLHHIFARGFVYGSLSYGQTLYFSSPRRVMKHLRELKPTVFFTVPRLLEKVYEGWLSALKSASQSSASQSSASQPSHPVSLSLKQNALTWAWHLTERYRLDDPQSIKFQSVRYRAQLWAARQSVFRPLRNLFGGRMQCFISGGAALPAEVMTLMSAAGLKLCQGYGLTEAGSTLSFTRRQWSRAGTVGVPMPGVEMTIASDGEVMVRSPYVMQGYYRHLEATHEVLEDNGWLHTGDRGEFSTDGLLTLTGHKKDLFKLSIGEYVAPQPIEQALCQSPLVQQALVVGPGRKFCGLLIFPEMSALATRARQMGLALSNERLIEQPQIIATYQSLVDEANASLPFWSTVKRFRLINTGLANGLAVELTAELTAELTVESRPLCFSGELDREALYSTFAKEIDALYQPLHGKTLRALTRKAVPQAVHQLPKLIQSTILSLTKGRPNHV